MIDPSYDLLVIGGGPTGSTCALRAARRGLRVAVLEQDSHPRFHIGESFLPRNLTLLRELGLEEGFRALTSTRKLGVSFALGHETRLTHYLFRDGIVREDPEAFNIERAPFDAFLLQAARDAGATTIERARVHEITRLDDGDVAVSVRSDAARSETFRGRYLVDASGHATIVGRHLGTRRTLPDLKKVAYYNHFRNVARPDGVQAGFPLIVMCREGWFWFIPLDDERTSVGLVMDGREAAATGVAPRDLLAWAISRCPLVRERMARADGPAENRVTADFTYACRPYAGPGYFLAGDAATFIDPIFSTGVCLGMMSAVAAADGIVAILDGGTSPRAARRRYMRTVEGSSGVFFRLVRGYYRHSFRELLLHGQGPFNVQGAVLSVLSGHVFPRPARSLRWRMWAFRAFTVLNAVLPLVERRPSFSLREGEARPVRGRARLATAPRALS